MAVKLSSDLIMDVMRNADPIRRGAAVEKLERMAGNARESVAFEAVMNGSEPGTAFPQVQALSLPFSDGRNATREGTSPYQGFERVVLRNLFEALLPDSGSGSFGEGPSAGVWRSMAADQLAGVYAEAGGIGIANMLADRKGAVPTPQPQWPYFSLPVIDGFGG
jgi:hypothetical protein